MNISLKKGNFLSLIGSIIIYLLTLIFIPRLIIPSIDVSYRYHAYIIIGAIGVIVLWIYSNKTKNSIDRSNNKMSLLISIAIGIGSSFIVIIAQAAISSVFNKFGLNLNSANTEEITNTLKFNYTLLNIVNQVIT